MRNTSAPAHDAPPPLHMPYREHQTWVQRIDALRVFIIVVIASTAGFVAGMFANAVLMGTV